MNEYTYSDALTKAIEIGDTSQLKEIAKEADRKIASLQKRASSEIATKKSAEPANQVPNTGSKQKTVRGVGRVFKRKQRMADGSVVEDPIWWIAYYRNGKEIRQSSGSNSETKARKLLSKRIKEIASGDYKPGQEKIRFDDLVAGIKEDYKLEGKRSLDTVLSCVKHLELYFRFDKAMDIGPTRVKTYQASRKDEGASIATINREVAYLRRMLSIQVELENLPPRASFHRLEGENVRQGFLEHGDFQSILQRLPEDVDDLVEYLYLSGWRSGEGKKLEWAEISSDLSIVRLKIEDSKNKRPRILVIAERLLEIIQKRKSKQVVGCKYVFHRKGKPIKNFRKAWITATEDAGFAGKVPHDLRRCAVRNLKRSGVDDTVAMSITGHVTRSVFDRYNIVSEDDLRDAIERQQAHLDKQPQKSKVIPLPKTG